MAGQKCVERYTEQDCGEPVQCTDNHQHYRSEMVPGITAQVSNNNFLLLFLKMTGRLNYNSDIVACKIITA